MEINFLYHFLGNIFADLIQLMKRKISDLIKLMNKLLLNTKKY